MTAPAGLIRFVSSALLCTAAAVIAAAQPGTERKSGKEGDGKAAPKEAAPKAPATAAAPSAPEIKQNPERLDAGLRTFAGPCLIEPAGRGEQAALGGLVAAVIPQVVSAGVDLLTGALDQAGADKITTLTAVLPLEHRARCIQVTRGVSLPSRGANPEAMTKALLDADFLVEFFLRQSVDGSAITVMPTVVRYAETIEGKKGKRTPRDLFATLRFSDVGASKEVAVSVPLGRYPPDPSQPPHYFDPIALPENSRKLFSAGAAASPWIKAPWAPVPVATQTGTTQTGAPGQPDPNAPTGAAAVQAQTVETGDPLDNGPPPPAPPRSPGPRQAVNQGAKAVTAPPPIGEAVAPYSISVAIRETRPGNAFARTLSTILKGSKQAIVDASDPAKREEQRAAELATWKTDMSGYAKALGDYYKKLATFCDTAADPPTPKISAAAELYASQIDLAAAARTADQPLPFEAMVVPGTDHGAAKCPAP